MLPDHPHTLKPGCKAGVCLVGEKPDKELRHSRRAWRYCLRHRVLSCICAWLGLFLPSHSSRVSSGDGLVGGNPTMNTPRLRRGGGIASYSNLVLLVLVLIFSIFCLSLSFRVGAMGSTSFLGFSCPNLLLVFLNLLFLGTCYIFFSQVLGLSLGLFILFFLYLILGLACDHGNSLLCL